MFFEPCVVNSLNNNTKTLLIIVYVDRIDLVIIISVYISKVERYRAEKGAKIAILVKKLANSDPFRCP